jgi:hypothetical protein
MCCFSRAIRSVSDTNIFARASQGHQQYLVYSMTLDAKEDLAMVLPLPAAPNAGEDAVQFIDLHDYADFFKDLRAGFPEPQALRLSRAPTELAPAALKVVSVGNFEASFVPSLAEFDRLDPRFRLPKGTWDKLPQYQAYGFAVFKLKPGVAVIHPMAFTFPRADASQLFFPTVHIHDGNVHRTAQFDHALYCQTEAAPTNWWPSFGPAKTFVNLDKAQGLINGEQVCYQYILEGQHPNRDIWIGAQ